MAGQKAEVDPADFGEETRVDFVSRKRLVSVSTNCDQY